MTIKLSEILSITVLNAIGEIFRKLYLNMAIAKIITANEKAIGVECNGNLMTPNVAIMFTVSGIAIPTKINIDCVEKIPEFFIDAYSKMPRPAKI